MVTPRRVVVYGNTLALAGIALSLESDPMLRVVTLEFGAATLAQRLRAESPHIILFDVTQTDVQTILASAEGCGELLVIGIQANGDQMLLWSGQAARAVSIQDLAQAIQAWPGPIHPSSPRPSMFNRRMDSIEAVKAVRFVLHWNRHSAGVRGAQSHGDAAPSKMATRFVPLHFAGRRKVAFSMLVIGLGLAGLWVLAPWSNRPGMNLPLVGTAVGDGANSPTTFGDLAGWLLLAFAGGIVLGGAVIALWCHRRTRNRSSG